jgi:hypothetical protein
MPPFSLKLIYLMKREDERGMRGACVAPLIYIYIKFSSSLISIGLRHVLFVSYYGPHIHKFHTFWASFFF